jgi:threonine dehydrogenase-like Zn-dependent dehydrogenase
MKTITYELNLPRLAFTKALGVLWRGAYFLPTAAMRLHEMPERPLPHERFVRVRPTLAGICGTDLHLAFIDGSPFIAPAALPGNSKTYLGHEVVGEVVEVGKGAQTLQVGDRVALQCGDTCRVLGREPMCRYCAEGQYALCEVGEKRGRVESVGAGWSEEIIAHELRFFKVPDDIRDEQACLIEPGAVGIRAVLRRPPRVNENVLVVGAGAIGLMTLQAVKAAQPQCHCVVMAKYPHQAEMARAHGADEIIGAREGYQGVARVTGAQYHRSKLGVENLVGGFDLIYDTIGTARTVTDCLRWARARGVVVLVGVAFKPLRVDLTPIWYQEVDLIGMIGHGREEWAGEKIETFALVVKWLREGKMNFDNYISARYPLSAYRQALAHAADKRQRVIRVALAPNANIRTGA